MALTTRVWSAGKIVLLLGALAATYLLSAAASMRIALQAREVAVPDLTDRTANDATSAATALGLALNVDEIQRPDPKIGAGRIVAQEPSAGSVARRRRSIKVWLSAGQRRLTVPTLIGETERTASLRLTQNGLTLAGISEIRSDDYPQDAIVAQQPPAKATGETVSLLVNRGAHGSTYLMPDLIGVNGERAAEMLRAHEFRVALVGSAPYPGVAAGVVLRQSPQAGFQIGPSEPVSLEVSR